ncbi:MAG: sodium:calcium antiporter, partial [Pseudomonadota bacterium]
FMMGASLLFIALAFTGQFGAWQALILLAALSYVLFDAFRQARAHRKETALAQVEEEEVEGVDPDMPGWQIFVFLVLGLVGLPLGADLLVDNASVIARQYGVSETVIGLTLVAVGTSLPELATTVMAALRRQADVALGNVIGSNMFNLLAIVGVASLVGPIPVAREFLTFDLWVMLGASLLLVPFVFMGWNITKRWGIALTTMYVAYLAIVIF